MRVSLRPLLLGLAGLMVTACSNLSGTDSGSNRYAALNVSAKNKGGSQGTGFATMIFFQGVNVSVPNSSLQQYDQCIVTSVDTSTIVSTGQSNVGSSLPMVVGTTSYPMTFNTSLLRYEYGLAAPQLTYNSGESVTVTVPSGSSVFPNSTLTLKLAEPIVPQSVTVPASGSDWTLRWNGTGDGVSSVQLQALYTTSSTATSPTEQVYCVVQDDGLVTIPSMYLTNFAASTTRLRSLRFLRWRTNENLLDATTLLHMASTIDTTITFP